MTRVRINADPMPALRATATTKVNEIFSRMSGPMAHQEEAWRRKKIVAQSVVDGSDATEAFTEEAGMRSLTAMQFAELILSKPDPNYLADARELRRQKMLLAIEKCSTKDEIEATLENLRL